MRSQSKKEEQLNAWTHGLGSVLGIIALIYLVDRVNTIKPWHLFSVIIYGLSIIILFSASTAISFG